MTEDRELPCYRGAVIDLVRVVTLGDNVLPFRRRSRALKEWLERNTGQTRRRRETGEVADRRQQIQSVTRQGRPVRDTTLDPRADEDEGHALTLFKHHTLHR